MAKYQKQRAKEEQRKYFLEGSRNRNEAYELFYNFVGNSADSLRWKKEYNQLYGNE